MAEALESPRSPDELYLARADEVSPMRPIMTGDVFRGIDIPGVDAVDGDTELLAMVVSHPCSMRQGAELRDRLQMVRIVTSNPIDLALWSKAHFDKLPLPDLTGVIDPDDFVGEEAGAALQARREETAHAALLDLRGRVRSASLDLDTRVACLTEEGIAYLHQRMSHYDTRYAPDVEKLMVVCAAVFAEADLLEQWNDGLVPAASAADADSREAQLRAVAKLFDDELSRQRPIPGKPTGRFCYREDLQQIKKRPSARRAILGLLKERMVVGVDALTSGGA